MGVVLKGNYEDAKRTLDNTYVELSMLQASLNDYAVAIDDAQSGYRTGKNSTVFQEFTKLEEGRHTMFDAINIMINQLDSLRNTLENYNTISGGNNTGTQSYDGTPSGQGSYTPVANDKDRQSYYE